MFDPDGAADGGRCLEQHDRSGEVNNMLYRKKEGGFRFGHVGKATMAKYNTDARLAAASKNPSFLPPTGAGTGPSRLRWPYGHEGGVDLGPCRWEGSVFRSFFELCEGLCPAQEGETVAAP